LRTDAFRFVAPKSHIRLRETTLSGRQVGVGVGPTHNVYLQIGDGVGEVKARSAASLLGVAE